MDGTTDLKKRFKELEMDLLAYIVAKENLEGQINRYKIKASIVDEKIVGITKELFEIIDHLTKN